MSEAAHNPANAPIRRPNDHEQRLKADALKLWEADRMRLMLHQPFVAMLAMRLDLIPVVDDRLSTACTDGERVFVNARFLHRLSPAERVFVLAHEVWHCAARHPLRRGRRQPRRWNIAADHEVNALLRDEGLSLARDCVYFPDLHGRNAESVYASQPCADLLDKGRGELADEHDIRAELASGIQDPDFDTFEINEDGWGNWPARVVAVAQQMQRIHGELPGNIHRFVDAYRKPQVPWREVLSQFVTRTLGDERVWLPPHRRWISRGLYLPSRRGQCLEATVAIDTSGSTTPYLPRFLGELIGLASSFGRYELRLLLCDYAIQKEITISDETPWEPGRLDFLGGGGTSFMPVFEHLARAAPPPALIFFTDGYGRAPSRAPDYPVLWALTPDGLPPAHWGERLWLDEEAPISTDVQGRYA